MPIKDLTDSIRLPRLGKIHLGTKHPEKGYPMKADHFVFPKDHSDYNKLVEVFGKTPTELRILIPVEDEDTWASQYYKAYSQTYGLICKGDGEVAMRMVDIKTGELPVKGSGTVELREISCTGRDCPDYQAKKCHEVMNLRFILPEVPGLGIWQIDTGSKNSIININSCATLIKRAFGRISMVPLNLTFEPIQVNNPEDGKKQTVYVLNLRSNITLAQLADVAREQAKTYMLEGVNLEKAYEIEAEKEIEELWGEESQKEQPEPKREPQPDAPQSKSEPPKKETKGNSSTDTDKVDMPWLIEVANKTRWDILRYIKDEFHVQATGNLKDIVNGLSEEQRGVLVSHAQELESMN